MSSWKLVEAEVQSPSPDFRDNRKQQNDGNKSFRPRDNNRIAKDFNNNQRGQRKGNKFNGNKRGYSNQLYAPDTPETREYNSKLAVAQM